MSTPSPSGPTKRLGSRDLTEGPPTEDGSPLSVSADGPTQQDRFGRYVIVERIGSGGMANVYRAHDPELDRDVALKLVRPAGKRRSERRAARLLREARALAELSHPNVVEVFDVGQEGSTVYMSMQLVRGPDLSRWLHRESRDWRDILQRFIEAGRGLQAAHEAGLVHRDFKPANVLIDAKGDTKVVDFGLVAEEARDEERVAGDPSTLDPSGDSLSQKDRIGGERTLGAVGTPVYMAPEQHVGDVDPRSDQFAFCVSLFEALYGHRPFIGLSVDELKTAKLEGLPRPRDEQSIPGWILPILRRGTAADPRQRYRTMSELLRALQRGQTRRRRLIRSALVVGSVAALAAVLWSRPTVEPCDAADDATSVWNVDRRQSIQRAFGETAVFAAGTTARAVEGIDAWVASHQDAARAVCSQRDEGAVSAQVLDVRFACLRAARSRLEPTLDLIEEGDVVQRVRSVDAIASMPKPDECVRLDVQDPRVAVLLAGSGERRDDALWTELERVEVGLQLGALEPSHDRLVLLDAKTASRPKSPQRAKWLALRQSVARQQGQPGEAARIGQEAFSLAAELGIDELAAESAIGLIDLEDPQSEKVERWSQSARVAIERLGGRDDLEALRLMALASSRAQARQSREALELGEKAWQLAQESLKDQPGKMLRLARTLVELRLMAGQASQALSLARKSTAEASARYGADHPDVAMLRSAGAQALAKTGQYQLAEQEYREAIELLVPTESRYRIATLRLNRGQTLMRIGRYEEALEVYEQALPAFERDERHTEVVLVLLAEAYVQELLGNYEDAFKRAVSARVAAEQALGGQSPLVVMAIVEQTNVLVLQQDVEQAAALLHRAEEIESEGPLPPSITVLLRSAAGKVRMAQQRHAEAVEQFELAAKLQVQMGAEPVDRAQVDFLLARARYELGQRDEAVELAGRAHRTFVEVGPGARLFRGRVESWLAERR